MDTTTGTVATDARAGLVLAVGTAPDARPRTVRVAVAPHPYQGAPAVAAPLSA